MKKTLAIVLALVMILGLATAASAASITITPPDANGGSDTGVTYEAYKIFDATINGDNVSYTIESTSPYFNTVKDSGYFNLTLAAGSTTTYVVVAKESYTTDAANTFADTLKAVSATASGSFIKQADGKYKNEDLDPGYYLITSSVGTDLMLYTLGDETVTSKNQYPTLEKKVEGLDATTANKGDILDFTISVNIPEDATGVIVVHDKMTGLEYQSMTAISGITASTESLGDDCTVHFTLDADYVTANRGNTITIEYTAKVTADTANNEAWLVDGTYTSAHDSTEVKTSDIKINKYTGTDANAADKKLADAQFVLYKTVDVGGNPTNYYYKLNGSDVTWVENKADATVVTTDATGTAYFNDVADGIYYLLETKAPAGYNLLTTPVTVTVENSVAAVEVVDVQNNAGSTLPETGGIGTTLFYIFGGILVVGAVVLLVTKKRMSVN